MTALLFASQVINPNLLETLQKKGTALDLFIFHYRNASFALFCMQNVRVFVLLLFSLKPFS